MITHIAEWPEDLFTVAQARDMDKYLIEQRRIPGIQLMKKAGYAAFSQLEQEWPDVACIRVVCGAGNNAGDGYVVACLALLAGYSVKVHAVVPVERLHGDARIAADEWIALSGETGFCSEQELRDADVIVDALFGTGLDRPVEGIFAHVIEMINCLSVPVLAIDIPSGLNGDYGCVMGKAVNATMTVTFIAMKRGLLTGSAPAYCGKLVFAPVHNASEGTHGLKAEAKLLKYVLGNIGKRQRSAHKGDFGHALLIGGSPGFSGAIHMAAESAARTGAGLTSVATHPEHAALINLSRPELMCRGVDDPWYSLDSLLQKATVVGIGPGLGQDAWGKFLLHRLLDADIPLPLVVDADALNLLAQNQRYSDSWILTPHPGEAARLLGCTASEINADRYAAVVALQERYGGVALLKGAGTLIYDGKQIYLCPYGNPGMASGGMGDILTGVITGLLSQRFTLTEAACNGVYLHARAADQAADLCGERGLLATDLLPYIQELVNT